MTVKLLTEQHLEFLSLKGGCRGSSEFTHVKMPHCWESQVTAHILSTLYGHLYVLSAYINEETVYHNCHICMAVLLYGLVYVRLNQVYK